MPIIRFPVSPPVQLWPCVSLIAPHSCWWRTDTTMHRDSVRGCSWGRQWNTSAQARRGLSQACRDRLGNLLQVENHVRGWRPRCKVVEGLEHETSRLKRLFADLSLGIEALKDLIEKSSTPAASKTQ